MDSPLEERRFEPSVPRRIDDAFETALFASAALPVPPERPTRFARGTGGSNPSSSGSQSVSLVPSAATGTKGPGFAANVSLDETRERDMLASNRLAFAFFLCRALMQSPFRE